jgi:hypothetical protein
MGFCGPGNVPFGPIKDGAFIQQLSRYQLLSGIDCGPLELGVFLNVQDAYNKTAVPKCSETFVLVLR